MDNDLHIVDRRLENIRTAFHALSAQIRTALLTQAGDERRLSIARDDVLAFERAVNINANVIPVQELRVCRASLSDMVTQLDDACHIARDRPDGPSLLDRVVRRSQNRRGAPSIEVDRNFLAMALTTRGKTKIAKAIGCSARTVRRRILKHGLADPHPPVFELLEQEDGSYVLQHNTFSAPVANLTNDELDNLVADTLEVFPTYGRKKTHGYIKSLGYSVPRERLRASLLRVQGVPRPFARPIARRRLYRVAGPNSLWHHDGQHSLIKYGFITHAFIDGYSRYVVGLRVSNNNRAQTVLDLFLDARDRNLSTPSRVRGDHGTENLFVAQWMEDNQGPNRGSYIWGRSVHNNRAERLWYDVNQGYNHKWKALFMDLEANEGLNVDIPAHKWLLHHLFLRHLNHDASEWVEGWNAHTLENRGEPGRSPRDMFLFGMLDEGPRGIDLVRDDDIGDPAEYGVDWVDMNNANLLNHLLENNPHENLDNLRNVHGPAHMNEVVCLPPNCPFTAAGVARLDEELRARVDVNSTNMLIRRIMWIEALSIYHDILQL